MIAAVLWKEYREQRFVWVTLAVVAVGVLVGLPLVFEPGGFRYRSELRTSLKVVTLVMAWTYGLVCGAMLLAGEREAGTDGFLDALPASRLGLWWAKLLAGLALVLSQVAFLAGLALVMRVPEDQDIPPGLLLLPGSGLLGLAWGMLLSTRADNVLSAIGQAIFWQGLAGPVVAGVLFVLATLATFLAHAHQPPVLAPMAVGALTLLVGPLVLSALIHSRTDRQRLPGRSPQRVAGLPGRPGGGWLVLLALARRQARPLALALLPAALVVGFALPVRGLVLWPALTLFVGCLCGVTAFADEQAGSYRFLGDQRFPPGRVWLVKVGWRLGLAVATCACLLLPG